MAEYEATGTYQTAAVQAGDYVQNTGNSIILVSPGAAGTDQNAIRIENRKAFLVKDATQVSYRSASGYGQLTIVRGL